MTQSKVSIITCGYLPEIDTSLEAVPIHLTPYDNDVHKANMTVKIDRFVPAPDHLDHRLLDLLDVAAYVYSADRAVGRGPRESVHNRAWARTMQLHIPVRDFDFWTGSHVSRALALVLEFMSGDREWTFRFYPYSQRVPVQMSLFSNSVFPTEDLSCAEIMLFSGGLDSLAGAIEHLQRSHDTKLCLVSHVANNSVQKTQTHLIESLRVRFPGRIVPLRLRCNFKGFSSIEESQRTRMFLFAAIAYVIACCHQKDGFFVYENGMTSINLPKQMDLLNARASRTTHPKTIRLMEEFLQHFRREVTIHTPFFWMTKQDVVEIFREAREERLISSAVSCSSTRNKSGVVPHCGQCSQCIDRRFAIHAAGLHEYDATYSQDFITHLSDDETKQRLYYTLRLATQEDVKSKADFLVHYGN